MDIAKYATDCLLGIIRVPMEQMFNDAITVTCKFYFVGYMMGQIAN
jgi:hypothetical protein